MSVTNQYIHPITSFFANPRTAIQHKSRITQIALLALWTTCTLFSFYLINAASLWYEGRTVRPIDPDKVIEVAKPVLTSAPSEDKSFVKAFTDIDFEWNPNLRIDINYERYLEELKKAIGFPSIPANITDLFITRFSSENFDLTRRKINLDNCYQAWKEKNHRLGPQIPAAVDTQQCIQLLQQLEYYQVGPKAQTDILIYFKKVLAAEDDISSLRNLFSKAPKWIIAKPVTAVLLSQVNVLAQMFELPERVSKDNFLEFSTCLAQILNILEGEELNDYTNTMNEKIRMRFLKLPFAKDKIHPNVSVKKLASISPTYISIANSLKLSETGVIDEIVAEIEWEDNQAALAAQDGDYAVFS